MNQRKPSKETKPIELGIVAQPDYEGVDLARHVSSDSMHEAAVNANTAPQRVIVMTGLVALISVIFWVFDYLDGEVAGRAGKTRPAWFTAG
jgi:hypothetical protein